MGFTIAEAVELPSGLSGSGLYATLGGEYRIRKLENLSAEGKVQYSVSGTLCYYTDTYKSKATVWKRPVSTTCLEAGLAANLFETLYTTGKALHPGTTIVDV